MHSFSPACSIRVKDHVSDEKDSRLVLHKPFADLRSIVLCTVVYHQGTHLSEWAAQHTFGTSASATNFSILEYEDLAMSSTPRLQPGRHSWFRFKPVSSQRSPQKHQPANLNVWQVRRVNQERARASNAASECANVFGNITSYTAPSTFFQVQVRCIGLL